MASFAETRAEFHRHAKAIDDRLSRALVVLDSSKVSLEQRLSARDTLAFLDGEAANLLTCARMVSFATMENRLQRMRDAIRQRSIDNEAAIAAVSVNTGMSRQLLAIRAPTSERLTRIFKPLPITVEMRRSAMMFGGKAVLLALADVSKQHTPAPIVRVWFRLGSGWSITTSTSHAPNAASDWLGPFRGLPDMLDGLESTVVAELKEMAHA